MLRRFLSKNKVYPDDVIVIESGINDILVRLTVVVCPEEHNTLIDHSILGANLVSQGSKYCGPAWHTSVLGRP